MLNEDHIINFLKSKFPEKIGDDAAILPFSVTESYVITKDILVEDVHFRIAYQSAKTLAHKSLQINFSDIVAMGASPKYVLMGISAPIGHEKYVNDFIKAFAELCNIYNVELIGGDTTESPDKFFISITAIGIVINKNIKYRTNASNGDIICVAGNLGYAHLGLQALENNILGLDDFKKKQLEPIARLEEGKWFGMQKSVTALMDISDGLYVDLKKLCASSNVAAQLNLDNFEISKDFSSACNYLGLDPITIKLIGGEDYGLLSIIKESDYDMIALKFLEKFGYNLKNIGQIINGEGIFFIQNDLRITEEEVQLKCFSHFRA